MCGPRAMFQSSTPVAIYLRNWIMPMQARPAQLCMRDRMLFEGITTWLLTVKFAEWTGSSTSCQSLPSRVPREVLFNSHPLDGVYIPRCSSLVLSPRTLCAAVCILRTRLGPCSLVLLELRSSGKYAPLPNVYVLPSSSATLV